jgi:hypothetical protein
MTKIVKLHRGKGRRDATPLVKPRNPVVVAAIAKGGAGAGRHGDARASHRAQRRAARIALRRGGTDED